MNEYTLRVKQPCQIVSAQAPLSEKDSHTKKTSSQGRGSYHVFFRTVHFSEGIQRAGNQLESHKGRLSGKKWRYSYNIHVH